MKKNWIVAGTAWAAIVALAWWLANSRIEICSYESVCKLRATATRDDILVWGAGMELAALVLLFVTRTPTAGSRRASERLLGSQSLARAAALVKALRVRARAIRHRRWWVVPAAGAMVLSAVLGWYFRGEQSDPYAAISRGYDDLIPAKAGGKPADPFAHLIPAPHAALPPLPEGAVIDVPEPIPPGRAPAPAQPGGE